ncbi:isochorismate synthase MenF [Veillonella sp. R32]|uniref:isochorismate synthase n=1 Tax=Veillonella sp. R32 TaxID=2021312 RepID=UPI001389F1C2|nr:isochorismate synthase [Veillonella sp. R32]KAF1683283.1 isochorismate synthase [Veillonella sp. R32]
MKYTIFSTDLTNPLAVWQHFEGEERVYWHDTQVNRVIVAAGRVKRITEAELADYPWAWYSQSFFDTIEDPIWQNMGNELVVFTHYYVKEEGKAYWVTATDSAPVIAPMTVPSVQHTYEMVTTGDYTAWQSLFEGIQQAIRSGEVTKVVASRKVAFHSETPFQTASIIGNLVAQNEGAFIFAYGKGDAVFLGASPEVLVRKRGQDFMSYALAGTLKKDDIHDGGDRLLHDPKNLREHQIVIDRIRQTMLAMCDKVDVQATHIMELPNLYHLRTLLYGHDTKDSILTMAKALHPTPAMGGEPREAALAVLKQFEPYERGLYAAPVGWVCGNTPLFREAGDGLLIVGIRSALVHGQDLYAYAGCGVVAESDCEAEYTETATKLQTILKAL